MNTLIYSRYNSVWNSLPYRGKPLLVGFTDLDWVDIPDDRNYTVGYVFSLGFGIVTWACKKQKSFSLSSAEAEYQAAVNVS